MRRLEDWEVSLCRRQMCSTCWLWHSPHSPEEQHQTPWIQGWVWRERYTALWPAGPLGWCTHPGWLAVSCKHTPSFTSCFRIKAMKYNTNSVWGWTMISRHFYIHGRSSGESWPIKCLKLTSADESAASCGWRDSIQRYEASFFSYRLPRQQQLPCLLALRERERASLTVSKRRGW